MRTNWVLAISLACALAAPTLAAAVAIDSASIQWRFALSAPTVAVDFADLTPGVPYSASPSGFDILCFGDDCANYRFGGSTASTTWQVDLEPTTLAYDFTSFQGSDDGGGASEDWDLFIAYSSTRPFQIALDNTSSASSVICGDCSHSFHADASTWQDGDIWRGLIQIYGAAAVTNGDQTLAQHITAQVSEVPEPSTWWLIGLGAGLSGWALRRRFALRRAAST